LIGSVVAQPSQTSQSLKVLSLDYPRPIPALILGGWPKRISRAPFNLSISKARGGAAGEQESIRVTKRNGSIIPSTLKPKTPAFSLTISPVTPNSNGVQHREEFSYRWGTG
jgi:hypothetical protein